MTAPAVPRDELIGRRDAEEHVLALLDSSPLVTLVGVAGVGKTSLARAVARLAADRYRHGVVWVDLVPAVDAAGVAATLMSAFAVRDIAGGTALQAVERAIADRQLLLVLDNAEHVARAAGDAARYLLRHNPKLAMLVTSREALAISGEAAWIVPSLAVPEPDELPPVEELAQVPSVELFVTRAQAAAPAWWLCPDDAEHVARICRALDGIPLAIEFAAVRVAVLDVADVASGLDAALGGPASRRGAARPRHVTLRTALDWSHDLLTAQEQILLRRLAVFAGGFTCDAAAAVCAGDGLEERDVGPTIERLVERSLVVPPQAGTDEPRFRLLETLRQYALERLEESGELAAILERHAEHYIGVAKASIPHLRAGGHQGRLHRRLLADHPNFLAILHRSVRDDGSLTATGQRMAGALGCWWAWYSSRFYEARRWLEAAMAGLDDPDGDRWGAGQASLWLGWLAFDGNDIETAAAHNAAAYSALEHIDPWHAALAWFMAEYAAAFERELHGIEDVFAEGRRRWAAAGDDGFGEGWVTCAEADTARMMGDLERAEERDQTVLEIVRRIKSDIFEAFPLHNLGHHALSRGDADRAVELFREAIGCARRVGSDWLCTYCLAGLGRAAVARGDWPRAAKLLGATKALLERMGTSQLQVQDQGPYDEAVAAARAALSPAEFDREWKAGHAMRLDDALALGLGEREPNPLTRRQREVAELVGRGLTNREIAEALTISEHTVARHVEDTMARLGLRSRVQIAAWVVEQRAA